MVVHLSGNQEKMIQEKIASGRYNSADEVISEALLALEQRDLQLDSRATAFKLDIEKRLADGPATPMDFDALKRRIREEAEARHNEHRH